MDIYVFIDTLELAHDRIITKLVVVTGDLDIIVSYEMSDESKQWYTRVSADVDYLVEDCSIEDYADKTYKDADSEIKDTINQFFDSHPIDDDINWHIINWYNTDEVSSIFSHILNDGLLVSSHFMDINDLCDYAGSTYDTSVYAEWILNNIEFLKSAFPKLDPNMKHPYIIYHDNKIKSTQVENHDIQSYIEDWGLTIAADDPNINTIITLFIIIYGYYLMNYFNELDASNSEGGV